MKRTIRRIGGVGIALGILAGLVGMSSAARVETPAITVSPTPPTEVAPPDPICRHFNLQTAAETQLTVTGASFPPGETVTISLPGVRSDVARVKTDASGTFTVAFTNPQHPSQMSEVVKAADPTASATARFLSGYATCLTDSTVSSWDGVGWTAGSKVAYRIGSKSIKTAVASARGTFSTTVDITCSNDEHGKDVTIVGTVYGHKRAVVRSSYDPC